MDKEFSCQNFPIDYLLKEVIILWRFYVNIKGCVGITIYWFEIIFIKSLKENIPFVKLFEAFLGIIYLPHLLNSSFKALILLVLFECKFLKFTFKVTFYINDTWILLKEVDELLLLVISEINSRY